MIVMLTHLVEGGKVSYSGIMSHSCYIVSNIIGKMLSVLARRTCKWHIGIW